MAKMTNHNFFSTFTLLFVTLLFLYSPLAINAQNPIFTFGDSVFDTGMTLYNGVRGAGAENFPYGETYFGQPSGRFCDGRTIPDYIGEYAGLSYPKPYLLPGLKDYTKGVNFASAAACILVDTRPNTINLKMQVDYFKQMVPKLKQEVGEAKANMLLSKAVYLFNIGGNDYVSLLQINIKRLPLPSSEIKAYMNKVIDNLSNDLKTIYNQGGRKFAFQNIGPLGCMPSVKYLLGYKGTCAPEALQLAKSHNALFVQLAKQLTTELPGFKYTIYDSYNSGYLRVLNGPKYGFAVTDTACCGSGMYNGEFTCSSKSDKFQLCPNPSDHLYFDAGHYTQKANQQFATEFWSGGSNVVAPYNLKTFLNMN